MLAYQNKICPKTDEESPNDRNDPMHFVVGGPAIDKEPDGHTRTEPHHKQETVFRFGCADTIGFHAGGLYSWINFAEDHYA
jgi:hypothetical protein